MSADLQELFDSAGRSAPESGGWNVDEVVRRGDRQRNTRRALTAAGALVTAAALVIGATVFVPKWNADVAPVDGGVTNTSHDVVDGLDFTISGPGLLHMRDQYTVTMVVKNTTAEDFSGGVGAGIFRSGYKGNLLNMGGLTINGSTPVSSSGVTEVGTPTGESETFLTWNGDVGQQTVIPAGASVTVTFNVNRATLSESFKDAYGWIAAVKRADKPIDYAAAGGYRPVVADPVIGDPNCTAINMTSVKVLDSRWRLNSVVRSPASVSGGTTTNPWVFAMGDEAQGFGSGLSQGEGSYPVDSALVRQSLAAAGVPVAKGDIWPFADLAHPSLSLFNPVLGSGPYLIYNGAEYLQVEYVGTCAPSGKPVTGIYVGGGVPVQQVLSCQLQPDAGTLAANAANYCPADSVAKKYGEPDGFIPGQYGMTVDATPPPATP